MPLHQTVPEKCKLSRRFSDYKITSPPAINRNGRTKRCSGIMWMKNKSSKAPLIYFPVYNITPTASAARVLHAAFLNLFPISCSSPWDAFSLGSKAIWWKFVFTISLVFFLPPAPQSNRFQPICLFAVQTRLFSVVLFFN